MLKIGYLDRDIVEVFGNFVWERDMSCDSEQAYKNGTKKRSTCLILDKVSQTESRIRVPLFEEFNRHNGTLHGRQS
jgi:hypothetical protein